MAERIEVRVEQRQLLDNPKFDEAKYKASQKRAAARKAKGLPPGTSGKGDQNPKQIWGDAPTWVDFGEVLGREAQGATLVVQLSASGGPHLHAVAKRMNLVKRRGGVCVLVTNTVRLRNDIRIVTAEGAPEKKRKAAKKAAKKKAAKKKAKDGKKK